MRLADCEIPEHPFIRRDVRELVENYGVDIKDIVDQKNESKHCSNAFRCRPQSTLIV